jgi:hypothetical protein
VALCPDGSPDHGRLAAWLNEQEGRYEVVVYEADPTPSAWTRRCLRQADQILVVGLARDEPSLGALGPELASLEDEQGKQFEHLVLLHRNADWRPQGTDSSREKSEAALASLQTSAKAIRSRTRASPAGK